ncbi:flagellar hook-length control protein FliK [Bacillus salacetis]|uniref:Flagellar hook-length control protein FliK n=1 Tax=Bacillus salacetis TaxID=2315464 RepID=A0A3A1R9D7_9BACI|nr:flagellar hook-length control protein FliK [Bacillus salacetis]RIW36411.1 flagellar hook-length control protein FliK [Bacillus salacetis]
MNVGAILSMQNLGQVASKSVNQASAEGGQDSLFSSLLTKANGMAEIPDQIEPGLMKIIKLLQALRAEGGEALEGTESSDLNIDDVLLQAGINKEDLHSALDSLLDQIMNTVPELKDVFPDLENENMEDVLFQVIETLSLMPLENLKKMDSFSLETALKAAKAFEQAFRQTDLGFRQAERAETLSQNLKVITKKIEEFLTGEIQKNGKWKQIVEKVFDTIVHPKDQAIQQNSKHQVNSMLNKNTVNEKVPQLISADSSGTNKAKAEGEQAAKLNLPPNLTGSWGQQHLSRAEQFSLFVSKGQPGTTSEQFVKEFANIIGKSQIVQTPNMSKLLIKLYPERLGSIRIELLQQDGVMTAKILAGTKAAKDILDSNLTGLRHALNSQNLQVEKIEIAQTFSESQRQERQQSQQQQSGQQPKGQSDNQQSNDKDEQESTFKELLKSNEV